MTNAREIVEQQIYEIRTSDDQTEKPYFKGVNVDRLIAAIEAHTTAALESHQQLITEMTEEEDRCRGLLAAYDKSSPDGVVPLSEVIQSAISTQVNEALERAAGKIDTAPCICVGRPEGYAHADTCPTAIAAEIRALKEPVQK